MHFRVAVFLAREVFLGSKKVHCRPECLYLSKRGPFTTEGTRCCLERVLSGGLVLVPPRLRGSAHGLAGWLHQVEPPQSLDTDYQLSEMLHLEREERVGDLPSQCACELSRFGCVLRCGCECGPGVVISGRRQQTLAIHKYKWKSRSAWNGSNITWSYSGLHSCSRNLLKCNPGISLLY